MVKLVLKWALIVLPVLAVVTFAGYGMYVVVVSKLYELQVSGAQTAVMQIVQLAKKQGEVQINYADDKGAAQSITLVPKVDSVTKK